MTVRWLAAAVLILAAACQPLPRPFEASRPPLSRADLASMGPIWGIVVVPVAALPADAGDALAANTAAALRARGIAASDSGRSEGRYVLAGEALASEADGTARVSLVWTIRDPRGGVYARTRVAQDLDAADWRRGGAALLMQLATASAAQIAPLIDRGGGEIAAIPQPVRQLRVHLGPIDGAPGDGRAALPIALAAALDLRGIRVVTDEADVPTVAAAVSVEPGPDTDRLAIRWAVLREDGEEIGAVEQANAVLRGSLDGRWGALAYDIATGAAEGLEDLLRTAAAPEEPAR